MGILCSFKPFTDNGGNAHLLTIKEHLVTVSVVIILPNQGSMDHRLSLMPYRREQFNPSARPSVHPSIHPSIRPPVFSSIHSFSHSFIQSFSNVIINFYTQFQGARKNQTRLIMENVAHGSFAEIHYSTEMFYKK